MVNSFDAFHRDPLAEVVIDPVVALLPKADIHLHQEWSPRLDRVLARRVGQPSYDWQRWARSLMAQTPPGMPRLGQLARVFPATAEADADPENFIARVEDLLEEGAADGALLVEMRFGGETALRPDMMALFREAERRVRTRYPDLRVTAHVGEFSTANIAAALHTPGLTRLGHAVYAARDPYLLDAIAASGITVECALSCNVVLGAAPSYGEHPMRRFVEHGIPVALCTDDPVQVCTTIGREYALAHALGFTPDELLAFTAHAIRAAFLPPERRRLLLEQVSAWRRQ